MEKCKVENCEDLGQLHKNGKKYLTQGYCSKHYKRAKKHGDATIIKIAPNNNRNIHPLYITYSNMKARCFNKNSMYYKDYGGRGIIVCDRWLKIEGFDNFLLDMGEKPSDKHTLDRINNNGNYEPANCKWSTLHEQNSNKRSNNKNIGVTKIHNSFTGELRINNIRYRKTFKTEQKAIDYRKELELKYLNT